MSFSVISPWCFQQTGDDADYEYHVFFCQERPPLQPNPLLGVAAVLLMSVSDPFEFLSKHCRYFENQVPCVLLS